MPLPLVSVRSVDVLVGILEGLPGYLLVVDVVQLVLVRIQQSFRSIFVPCHGTVILQFNQVSLETRGGARRANTPAARDSIGSVTSSSYPTPLRLIAEASRLPYQPLQEKISMDMKCRQMKEADIYSNLIIVLPSGTCFYAGFTGLSLASRVPCSVPRNARLSSSLNQNLMRI